MLGLSRLSRLSHGSRIYKWARVPHCSREHHGFRGRHWASGPDMPCLSRWSRFYRQCALVALASVTLLTLNGCASSPDDEAMVASVITALPTEVTGCTFITEVDNNFAASTMATARNRLKLQVAQVGGNTLVETYAVKTLAEPFWGRPFYRGLAAYSDEGFYITGRAYLCHTFPPALAEAAAAAQQAAWQIRRQAALAASGQTALPPGQATLPAPDQAALPPGQAALPAAGQAVLPSGQATPQAGMPSSSSFSSSPASEAYPDLPAIPTTAPMGLTPALPSAAPLAVPQNRGELGVDDNAAPAPSPVPMDDTRLDYTQNFYRQAALEHQRSAAAAR